MYCYKCGKQISDSPDYLCSECRAAQETEIFFGETEAGENSANQTPANDTMSMPQNENVPTPEMQEYGYNHNGYYKRDASVQPKDRTAVENPSDTGFSKALAATIVGVIGLIASVFAMEFSALSLVGEMGGIAILATVASLGMGVLALVFGVQSIRRFKALRAAGLGKPVATLVLGIVAIAAAGYTLLFVYLSYSFLSCSLVVY